jgi:hypothetical protein
MKTHTARSAGCFIGMACAVSIATSPSFAEEPTPVDLAKAYSVGAAYTYNIRTGYLDFKDVSASQEVALSGFGMYGLILGKRFVVSKSARVAAQCWLDMGGVVDDTLNTTALTAVRHTYYHCGLEPEVQFCAPKSDFAIPFVRVGAGLHYTYIRETTFWPDSSNMPVQYTDLPYVNDGSFAVSAMAGFGFDIALEKLATISLAYSLRYWQPVHYEIKRDFIVDGQPYHETFFSHGFLFSILFNLK